MTTVTKTSNRLINEKSPYLQQHANNPVDWYPWGDEAFNKAKAEDKPIFLSIGYSTCHWCHVMAHECFEDEEVAKLMNDTFISIKVDREERPDIDSIYMSVCQIVNGSGGWPLSIILTPDKKPLYADTYIPKNNIYGRVGMMELIPKIREVWYNNRDKTLQAADSITSALKSMHKTSIGESLGNECLNEAYKQFDYSYDAKQGGFGDSPKFPSTHNLMFLLRYWKRNKDKHALDMVLKTLDAMSMGGIFDQLGFGFHRYSTDSKWLVPHFEKMLYDQALLAMAYTEGYQITKNEGYKAMVGKIFSYVFRDLTSKEGGFYSAEDADSDGEEGKFYTWTYNEMKEILEEDEFKLACEIFNIKKEGNFKEASAMSQSGLNIIYLSKLPSQLEKELKKDNYEKRIEDIRLKLLNERNKRVRPARDDKILVDWNGLMIAALSKASAAFQNPDYSTSASRAVDFILKNVNSETGLTHRYKAGEWSIPANIDDYAFLIFGLLELYEATFQVRYLSEAIKLSDECIKYLWDEENGGFYFTSSKSEIVLVRHKEIYDGAVPSGNSVSLHNLVRLGRITGDTNYDEMADKLIRGFSNTIDKMPSGHAQFLNGLDFMLGPTYEIVVAGNPESNDTKQMISKLRNFYLPNSVIMQNPCETQESEIYSISSFIKQQGMIEGKATAYVCKNYACGNPTTSIDELIKNFD